MTMRKIFRPTLTALVDDYAAGNLTRREQTFPQSHGVYVQAKNIDIGDIIKITGLVDDDELEPDKFLQYYLTNGFLFKGEKYTPGSSVFNDVVGVAEEPIGNRGVGRVNITGLQFGKFYDPDNQISHRVSCAASGRFKHDPLGSHIVIAKSKRDSDNVGYAIMLFDEVTGPFDGYYYSGTHQSCSVNTGHVHLNSPAEAVVNASVPLGSLEGGTRVLIMKSQTSGNWIVTEAECPAEE